MVICVGDMRQEREREERVRQEREREERVRQERVKEERERKERVRQEREREERVRQERKKDVKRENNNNNKVCSRLQSEFMFHVLFLPQAGLLQVKKDLSFPSATMEGVHLVPWKTILGLILVYSSSA